MKATWIFGFLKLCFMFFVIFVTLNINISSVTNQKTDEVFSRQEKVEAVVIPKQRKVVVITDNKPVRVVSSKNIECLAMNIYHEARGEPHDGKVAVGYVVLNRVESSTFPKNICEVVKDGGEILNKCQFSWWCDGRSDQPKDKKSWRTSLQIASSLVFGKYSDPTQGALFYHSTQVSPRWAKKMTKTYHVGRHLFFKPS